MASRGFTLIELLVVMTVMAVLLATAPRLYTAAFPAAELKALARDMASGLQQARSQALAENREVRFTLDLDEGVFTAGDAGPARPLADDVDVRVLTARSEQIGSGVASILFHPDGGSSGGRISLSRGGRSYDITINWLTGRIAIHD